MFDNVVTFAQWGLYQMLQPFFAKQRFDKHRLKAGIATKKPKFLCYATA
jgi:hypothetical protein